MSLKNIRNLILAATDKIPVTQMFINDLESTIKKIELKGSRKPSKSYKPSSLNCIRGMYFQMVGAELDEGEPSPTLTGICESGSDRHERIQRVISKMIELGFDCEYLNVGKYVKDNNLTDWLEIVKQSGFETKLFHKKLKLSFLCDGLIRYRGELYILEIKTESIYKFMNRNDVAPEHKPQGTAYCEALDLNKVMFVYENRNSCEKKAFILEVTETMKHDLVVAKINNCNKYVESNCVPPKPLDITTKTCQYCSYKQLCKENK